MFWRVKYKILTSDIEALESFLGAVTLSWGLWLLFADNSAFYDLVAIHGGPYVWSLGALGASISQFLGVLFLDKTKIKTAEGLPCVYWVYVFYSSFPFIRSLYLPVLAFVFSVSYVYIIVHRTAVDETLTPRQKV